jgi:S1-C subfamily serine protease
MSKSTQFQQPLSGAVRRAGASVVRVASGRCRPASGIVIEDGFVVTSSRAIGDGDDVHLAQADDGREAAVIGRDRATDIALVKLEGDPLGAAIAFADAGALEVGDLCVALGRPGRSLRASMRILGVIAGETALYGGGKLDAYIESDRALAAGFAGGPLVDVSGEAIGMNTRAAIRGADLALPHATIARVVAQLRAHGTVPRGYLGVGVQPLHLPAALAGAVRQDRGTIVVALEEDGPADKGGVLVGDILLSLAGSPLRGPRGLAEALFDRAAQDVELGLVRGGKATKLTLQVGTRGAP